MATILEQLIFGSKLISGFVISVHTHPTAEHNKQNNREDS
jgi:hypothetical protein